MNADDRILLLDLENLGSVWLRPRPLRARLETLLASAGEIHHAVAAYALPAGADADPLASLLAELRIAPLRVAPGADAAELALLAHARHSHAEGARNFLVGSADGRFAELAGHGRVELLVWDGQPIATRLADIAHHVHRITRPTSTSAERPRRTRPAASQRAHNDAGPDGASEFRQGDRKSDSRRDGHRCRHCRRPTPARRPVATQETVSQTPHRTATCNSCVRRLRRRRGIDHRRPATSPLVDDPSVHGRVWGTTDVVDQRPCHPRSPRR